MGVTYSHSSGHNDDTANHLGILRLSYVDADNLVNTYFKHQFQPTMKADSLQRLFYAAYGPRLELEMTATLDSCKQIFKDSSST